ncbi:MAG: SDR family oxidoreductase [Alphaproteobacteria bacterium]|nr:SDR family oxidoreductase [Alphaproteobacteria bacterium]
MTYRTVFRPGLFKDHVVIVTGGGSGIGRCTAHELAALGAKIALVGRKGEKLAKVRDEIVEDGGEVESFVCDIREEEKVKETVAAVLRHFKRIDGLVNNAGGQFPAPLVAISQKGWETVVRTNLTGGFLMARECYSQWMEKQGGSIVNIVADMWRSMPGMGHSGAARMGMVSFTETASVEWGHSGVRINAVAPGWIASSGMDQYPPEMREHIRNLKRHLPLHRLGTEAEVSAAIVFLLSEASSFISGTCIRVDGAAPNARAHVAMPAHERSKPYEGFHRGSRPKVLDGT